MVFEVCVSLITAGFIVLVIFIASLLVSLIKTLRSTTEMLKKVEASLDPLSSETVNLLRHTNAIAGTAHKQIQNFDPLLHAIANVGKAFEGITASWAEKPESRFQLLRKGNPTPSWEENVSDLLELAAFAINVWQNIQKRR